MKHSQTNTCSAGECLVSVDRLPCKQRTVLTCGAVMSDAMNLGGLAAAWVCHKFHADPAKEFHSPVASPSRVGWTSTCHQTIICCRQRLLLLHSVHLWVSSTIICDGNNTYFVSNRPQNHLARADTHSSLIGQSKPPKLRTCMNWFVPCQHYDLKLCEYSCGLIKPDTDCSSRHIILYTVPCLIKKAVGQAIHSYTVPCLIKKAFGQAIHSYTVPCLIKKAFGQAIYSYTVPCLIKKAFGRGIHSYTVPCLIKKAFGQAIYSYTVPCLIKKAFGQAIYSYTVPCLIKKAFGQAIYSYTVPCLIKKAFGQAIYSYTVPCLIKKAVGQAIYSYTVPCLIKKAFGQAIYSYTVPCLIKKAFGQAIYSYTVPCLIKKAFGQAIYSCTVPCLIKKAFGQAIYSCTVPCLIKKAFGQAIYSYTVPCLIKKAFGQAIYSCTVPCLLKKAFGQAIYSCTVPCLIKKAFGQAFIAAPSHVSSRKLLAEVFIATPSHVSSRKLFAKLFIAAPSHVSSRKLFAKLYVAVRALSNRKKCWLTNLYHGTKRLAGRLGQAIGDILTISLPDDPQSGQDTSPIQLYRYQAHSTSGSMNSQPTKENLLSFSSSLLGAINWMEGATASGRGSGAQWCVLCGFPLTRTFTMGFYTAERLESERDTASCLAWFSLLPRYVVDFLESSQTGLAGFL
ncbi:hypothetical protein RRG08_026355 [Elysia crispata]|uniref:Uncharacterized protein n=1 Tax=Elysia crispata TaxID=231223 RepID=A0AAE1CJB2_9GAST|nr:hypothetical protein RRG08_026355 [Elysia crispata]